MDDVILNSFPRNEAEALAMLYVQQQNLSGLTPEAVLAMYQRAYKKIRAKLIEQQEPKYKEV